MIQSETFIWEGEPYVDPNTDNTVVKARLNGRRKWFHFSDYAVENHGLDSCKERAARIARSSRDLPDKVLIKT